LIADSRPVRAMASGAQDINHLDEIYDGEVWCPVFMHLYTTRNCTWVCLSCVFKVA
jgi:hypothetical protein